MISTDRCPVYQPQVTPKTAGTESGQQAGRVTPRVASSQGTTAQQRVKESFQEFALTTEAGSVVGGGGVFTRSCRCRNYRVVETLEKLSLGLHMISV